MRFNIICNFIAESETMAGGYRILIELSRRWIRKGHSLSFFTSKEGTRMIQRYIPNQDADFFVTELPSSICKISSKLTSSSIVFGVAQTMFGSLQALKAVRNGEHVVIFSATPFWPDILPGYIMHIRLKGSKWIVPLSMFAPDLLSGGFSGPFKRPYRLPSLRDIAFYLNEASMYGIIKRNSDLINVTNELDRKRCINDGFDQDRVMVIKGGVDTKLPALAPSPKEKKYEAVFIGRLHPQKGVLELVDIWKHVCDEIKSARLAIIGNGPLENQVRRKIAKYKLDKNIDLLGFLDGVKKIEVFKKSKMVLHPAIYDSGGMAACEAMVCGLPGISFDLPALRVYYPKGMLKTECFDLKAFTKNIIRLLKDRELYESLRKDALDFAKKWDWDYEADEVLSHIEKLFD
jgi:glycosyltransferase involved in cell wall biosynthesis